MEGPFHQPAEDEWRPDHTCSYCGSDNPDELMKGLEEGTIELTPTDKNYKVYVGLPKGPFHRKFYFQHLSEAQMKRFVELYNDKKLIIGMPGYFYNLPFFMRLDPK